MIYQDNEFVRATYSLTLDEKRLVLLALDKVDPEQDFDLGSKEPLSVKVLISEWVAHFGNKSGAHTQAYNAVMSLSTKAVQIPGQDYELMWLDKRPQRPSGSHIWLHFGYSLSLHFRGLPYWDNWTEYRLVDIAKLPSFPIIRLYEEMAKWQHAKSGVDNISLEELRTRIDPENKYPRYADLNRRVITPGIAAINEHTNLQIVAKTQKAGRTVTGYRFKIKRKEKPNQVMLN
jgi:hypothetical protein